MPLSIHDARGVYYLSGELDANTAEDFAEAVASVPDGRGELVIDLSALDFIDSMGVRMLALLSRRIGGGLVLRYPQDAVSRVFESAAGGRDAGHPHRAGVTATGLNR